MEKFEKLFPSFALVSEITKLLKFPNFPITQSSSRFFQLHQKALEFRRVRVGISYRRREPVGNRSGVPIFVFLDAAISLMNRKSDLINLLAINRHGLDPLGDERFRNVVTSRAR